MMVVHNTYKENSLEGVGGSGILHNKYVRQDSFLNTFSLNAVRSSSPIANGFSAESLSKMVI